MKYALIFIPVAFLAGCRTTCKDADLKNDRQDYTGQQLRVDGYYYKVPDVGDDSDHVNSMVLYRNGVYIGRQLKKYEDLVTGNVRFDTVTDFIRGSKISWGVYRISGNRIMTEAWRVVAFKCMGTELYYGLILNDTTIALDSIEANDMTYGYQTYRFDNPVYYKFHFFPNKGDSTNNFIK